MKTDWIADFFSAMHESGEDISIVYGQKAGAPVHAEPSWFELPHDQFDGISGLASLLRRQGLRVDKLPVLRGDRLTLSRAVRGLFAVLPTLKVRQRQWRNFDARRKVRFLPVRERVAWHLFTEEQTAGIVKSAKAADVTVNTYLLFHLDAAVSAQLTPPATGRRWMIPVNLRGAVTRPTPDAPCISFIGADIDCGSSLDQLQTQITRMRERACHWGSWIALHAGEVIGGKAMRRDLRSREEKNHGWTGIFSNLGVWEVPGSSSWVFCPAIWRSHPVGAGCLTMNGRMAITIQLHDAFYADLGTSYALLKAWQQACLQEPVRIESNTGQPALRSAECV